MGDEHGHDHHDHDHEHDHAHGGFATGQEEIADTDDKEHVGDFAEGQAHEHHGHDDHDDHAGHSHD